MAFTRIRKYPNAPGLAGHRLDTSASAGLPIPAAVFILGRSWYMNRL
jgi:hypothetical protein